MRTEIVAVTGATGFAGRHAVAELLKRGHRVKALVRDRVAQFPAGVEIVQGDLHNSEALRTLLRDADAVVHLAGAVMALGPQDYVRVNAEGTARLAEAAMAAGTRRFVHVSSLAARRPELSPYAASKRAGEEAVARLDALIVRPPAVYGPGGRAMLPLFRELTRPVAMIPGRRDSRFSLLYVTDLARLLAEAVTSEARGIHEVSDGRLEGYGWSDILAAAGKERRRPVRGVFLPQTLVHVVALTVETAARIRGKSAMISRGKVNELYAADWVARGPALPIDEPIPFERGFAETLAWYRAAGWLPPAREAGTRAAP